MMKKAVSKQTTVAALAALTVLVAPSPALGAKPDSPVNITYKQDYDLFYQDQVRVMMPRTQAIIPRAYHRITQQWHLQYPGLLHPLTVQFEEIPSETLRRWKVSYLETQGSGDGMRFTLVVDIGAYLEHPDEDLEIILTHEMAHAVLRDVEAGPQASPIPPWFDEGMAQSTTHEGRDRVRQDIQELSRSGGSLLLCDLDGPVDEFAHGPFNASCYPEYYLAVRRLRQLGGPHTLEKIIPGLQDGRRMTDLILEITKMDWAAFQKNVARYAEAVFAGSQPIP
jgi:hypothetical protein